jgi:hypothetical protein
MKLSSASNHLATPSRGGGRRSTDDKNAARSRGIAQQARATKTDNSDSFSPSTEEPLPMDEDGLQRRGYAYKGEAPWLAPPVKDAGPTVFRSTPTNNVAPQIRQFSGTINLGFSKREDKRGKINVSLLLERFVAFVKQTDGEFRIDPLNDSAQCIVDPRNIPTSKEGVELYYQHHIVADGIRGESTFPCLR